MNQLQVGFSVVNVNPPLGIAIGGYYVPRFAKGFLDDLEVRTLALSCVNKKILLISVPVCGVNRQLVLQYCEQVERETGIPKENIFLSATHTHTNGMLP